MATVDIDGENAIIVKTEDGGQPSVSSGATTAPSSPPHPASDDAKQRSKPRRKNAAPTDDPSKRRCVSTACIACRKRKSKCDGNVPACAACKQVYGTQCIYDPSSDHRRKGVYRNDADRLKTKGATLQTLVQAILNYPEEDVSSLVREIRTCESLDAVADKILAQQSEEQEEGVDITEDAETPPQATAFETQLYGKIGDLRLSEGSVRFIGGTSNLMYLTEQEHDEGSMVEIPPQHENPMLSWTNVTKDQDLVIHLLNMYWTWHATFFCTISKTLFYRDFHLGRRSRESGPSRKTYYCSPLLVNAILALGCHFTSWPGAFASPDDSSTAGDHFFREAKRLLVENDEHETPRLTTVQAMALMSVREAGCGREAKGWVYSGMAFRMAYDMGLHLNTGQISSNKGDDALEDVRRITFWGCYLFDKCWSNYLGRLPQLPTSIVTVPKFEVFPDEDSTDWTPYTDSGYTVANKQPARTRAVALQISALCEISNDLMNYFYNPSDLEKPRAKPVELKMLSDVHSRLESWRRELPKEFEPKEGCLSHILVMHMFFQLLFIHLFRPFLKYTQQTSPLPPTISPRKVLTQAATTISKLMRIYKRSHGLRQICNIAVYIIHSACTIHLHNLPDRNAKRDILHGVKHLEEIAQSWLCARRTLVILSHTATKFKVELPDEAASVLARTDIRFASYRREMTSPSPQAGPGEGVVRPVQFPAISLPMEFYHPGVTLIAPRPKKKNTTAPNGEATPQDRSSSSSTSQNYQQTLAGNANNFVAQQQTYQPSPTTAMTSQTPTQTSNFSTQGLTSPTDMFSAVDQLAQEANAWVYRDQAQYATGFENWPSSGVDMNAVNAGWPSVVDDNLAAGGAAGGGGMNGMMGTTRPFSSVEMQFAGGGGNAGDAGFSTAAGNVNGDGLAQVDWSAAGIGGGFEHLGSYNEEEFR